MEIETIQYEDMDLRDPVGVIGFPTVGLTSSIMANMYVRSLDMSPVAGMASPSIPPYCIVSQNTVMPPVRFFGYKNKRKTGQDVLLCMTEYTPKPEDCFALANKILLYMRQKGCRTIITLEGSPKYENSEVLALAAGPNKDKLLKKAGLNVMKEGMIRGISGILMYEAPNKGMDIISIMVPATPGVPDPGSSISFIDPISRIIPGFKTTPNELLKEAEIIRAQLEEAAKHMNNTQQYIG